jgi:hypothetical protein
MSNTRSHFDMPSEAVMRARQQVVLDHFHDEVKHAWDDVLATFPHPHYELIAQMRVHDGDREVRQYFTDSRRHSPIRTTRSSRSGTATTP